MKILSKILVLLLTAGVSSSCLSHLKYDKTTGEIRLRPVVGLGTRSGEDFIPFPEDREFRVTAVSRDSGENIWTMSLSSPVAPEAGSLRTLHSGHMTSH